MNSKSWIIAAILSVSFLAFSVWVATQEGPFGFWVEHTRNLWGNQIGIDLVAGISVALVFIAPRARKAGINLVPWVALTVLGGSIGLLAFVARVFYAEAQNHR